MTYHNPHELEPCGEVDRSQVKPFSVMMFDDEAGWQQSGVYATLEEAEQARDEAATKYDCKAAVADTNAILDLADPARGDSQLWELPEDKL